MSKEAVLVPFWLKLSNDHPESGNVKTYHQQTPQRVLAMAISELSGYFYGMIYIYNIFYEWI
jgi:hypothetical protein